ncbi:DUF4262 domain-containing protein [Bradyrhizobium sp. dw_78]|uniref:DUF4262 domain-containing protein n=1 Tax=Bradyrhizobium sp. dw_78 TaxID=2719793 RepID=UPI001BD50400|nr:DUF4262 domain-containing protein [Bradyrhizobium sp. dw_78]
MQDNFEWPKADHEADEIIFRNVRKHGCHIATIGDGDPPFAFSIGLFLNYGHPELIIFGMRPESAQLIINDVRDRAAAGHTFVDGDISDDFLLDGYKLAFWHVPLMAYPEYLGMAIWFYGKSPRPFPCLQLIWQDRNRRFPWEAECSPEVKADQPLLKKTGS